MKKNLFFLILILILISSCANEGSNSLNSKVYFQNTCLPDYSLSYQDSSTSSSALPLLSSETKPELIYPSERLKELKNEIKNLISEKGCLASVFLISLNHESNFYIDLFSDWKLHPMSTYKPILSAFYYMTIGLNAQKDWKQDKWKYYEEQNKNMIVKSDNYAATRIFKLLDGEKYYNGNVLKEFNEFMRINGMKDTTIKLWNFYINEDGSISNDPAYEPKRINSEESCDFCIECNQVATSKDYVEFLKKLYNHELRIKKSVENLPKLNNFVKNKVLKYMERDASIDNYGFVGTFDESIHPNYFSKYGYYQPSTNSLIMIKNLIFPPDWNHLIYDDMGYIFTDDDKYAYSIMAMDCHGSRGNIRYSETEKTVKSIGKKISSFIINSKI